MMHAEIVTAQQGFLRMFQQHRLVLAKRPTDQLRDLQHEAAAVRNSDTYSLRVAAELTHAACTLILEERG